MSPLGQKRSYMGLDMYLSKKKYIGMDDRKNLKVVGANPEIDSSKVEYIVTDEGYWRKANAIHKWFVDNVQDGNDNCATYYVTHEQLKQLLDTVNRVLEASELVDGKVYNGTSFKDGKAEDIWDVGKVIKDPSVAMDLLPTQEGFFFGNTGYDEYYYDDLQATQEILTNALRDDDDSSADFVYQSSW